MRIPTLTATLPQRPTAKIEPAVDANALRNKTICLPKHGLKPLRSPGTKSFTEPSKTSLVVVLSPYTLKIKTSNNNSYEGCRILLEDFWFLLEPGSCLPITPRGGVGFRFWWGSDQRPRTKGPRTKDQWGTKEILPWQWPFRSVFFYYPPQTASPMGLAEVNAPVSHQFLRLPKLGSNVKKKHQQNFFRGGFVCLIPPKIDTWE